MKRLLLSLMLCFSVISCASLNPLDILNPDKPSLEVNAQVGKTNEQEKNNIKVESGKQEIKQEADKISNDHNYTADKIENITQSMSKWELALYTLLAGIAIPKANVLYNGVKTVVRDVFDAAIGTPVKGISNFILKLFGKA